MYKYCSSRRQSLLLLLLFGQIARNATDIPIKLGVHLVAAVSKTVGHALYQA